MLKPLDVSKLQDGPPPPPPWLVRSFVCEGAVTLLYGEAGMGKSYVALALAKAVADGSDIFGTEAEKSRSVVVDIENAEDELLRRYSALNLNDSVRIHQASSFSLGAKLEELEECLIENGPAGMLILDSARRLWPDGDENDSGSVSGMLMKLSDLARNMNVAIILLHHMNKSGTFRGSGAWIEVPEIAIEVGRVYKDKVENRRYLRWEKCRMAAPPYRKWFVLQSTTDGRVDLEPSSKPDKQELWSDD